MQMGNRKAPFNITVATTATLITGFDPSRSSLTLRHQSGTSPVYLGDSNVTTATGYDLTSGQEYVDENSIDALYGIVAATTAVVEVIVVNATGV